MATQPATAAKPKVNTVSLKHLAAALAETHEMPKKQGEAILNDLVNTDSAPLEAVALWGDASDLTAVNLAAMLPVVEKSSARAPHNTGLLRGLASLHERLGQPEQARECYDRIILVSDRPEERLWAQKQSDSVRLKN